MRRKTIALLLALMMCLALLSACGANDTPDTGEPTVPESTSTPTGQEPADENKEQPTQEPEQEEPKEEKPEEPAKPTQQEPENKAETKPAVPAEMTYTFDAATGTLTCSGGGEIDWNGYIDVIKNTIFELDSDKCRQAVKKVVIEDGVTAIGFAAFKDTMITEITIPDSVTRINNSAFASTLITNITIPDSVTELDGSIFAHCKNLSNVTLPKNITRIHQNMFGNCVSLTNIQIPEGVTAIEGSAFGNSGLTSITIPDGVTSIGGGAFESCPITQITIPASVTEWRYEAVYDCSALTDITFLGDTDMNHIQNWIDGLLFMPVTIHAPAGSVIEGYVNRMISEIGAEIGTECTFAPIN